MYDKLKIEIPNGYSNSDILTYLESDNIRISTSKYTDFKYYISDIDNLLIRVFYDTSIITGSLCKFYFGNNISTLDRKGTKAAVKMLIEKLPFDFGNSKMSSLEFGNNFVVKKNPREYFSLFGASPHLNRLEIEDSAYSQSKGARQYMSHKGYDKGAESQKKYGLSIPFHPSLSLLRFEISFHSHLPRHLRAEKITLELLYDETFYKYMVNKYIDIYHAISKQPIYKINAMNNIRTVSDGANSLLAKLLINAAPNIIENHIQELRDNKVFDDPKYYTRVNK